MRTRIAVVVVAGISFAFAGCQSEAGNEPSSTGAAKSQSSSVATAKDSPAVAVPEQGGGVIVIGETTYPVVADWSCNFIPYADTVGATGHGADDETIEFAFNLTIQTTGAIAGQITLRLTEQDVRWETADAGGDELASGIFEAELLDDGATGRATFRQRASGQAPGSSAFEQGSFTIRCPAG